MTIYNGTQEFIKRYSRKQMYISDEQLHAMQLCIYHCIKVQVNGLKGGHISQICRCTGSHCWPGGD
jgi:hypothetical protein